MSKPTDMKGSPMSKKVLVPIADGTEELEAIAVIDVLRRAQADVIVASVDDIQITASRGTRIIADKLVSDCTKNVFDLIALPGGMPGAEHLRDCPELIRMLKYHVSQGRLYAAICASPAVVLQHHGLLGRKKATCHPVFANFIKNQTGIESHVVVDGNCITSRGAGTAIEFALTLVALLYDRQRAQQIGGHMLACFDFSG
jgi:4-methyl-5(b-hydroxyethyl)-thiazole monophosphate biosynthesis